MNAYDCPTREKTTGMPPLEYMIAVMQGVKDGKALEYRYRAAITWTKSDNTVSFWNWPNYDYRIVKPEMAFKTGDVVILKGGPSEFLEVLGCNEEYFTFKKANSDFGGGGRVEYFRKATNEEILKRLNEKTNLHNPDFLTDEQIEVKLGWRLLDKDEIKERVKTTNKIQEWWNGWNGFSWIKGCSLNTSYRTKLSREELAALDKSKEMVKVPLAFEDWPAVIWIRDIKNTKTNYSIQNITNYGIEIVVAGSRVIPHNYIDLMNWAEYSSDRINWKPCYKEIEK